MQKIIRFLRLLSYLVVPPRTGKKAIALFEAFYGQYTCNPKYILLKLHEKAPGVKLYLFISERHGAADPLPDFVVPVRNGSLRHRWIWRRCNVFVTNGFFTVNDESLARLFLSPKAYKSFLKKKLIISTWHGNAIVKKIGVDEVRRRNANSESAPFSDFVIAGTRKKAEVLSTSLNHSKPFPVSLTGTPRCDILINGDADVAALKEKLGLPKDKRLILFAPTFRSSLDSEGKEIMNAYESGIRQMNELDVPRVLEALQMRFGGEWAFALRVHYFVVVEMRGRRAELPAVIDGNRGDDMMEYLACTDVLLTDYSGSMADFALTGRPCFLYALDREHYESEERGFYLDYDALPFPFAESCGALIANILAFDEAAYKAGVSRHLEWLGCVEDGKSSERVADCILHYINTGEKRLETVDGVDVR